MADRFATLLGEDLNARSITCVGNHDLAARNDKAAASDPRYGKRLLPALFEAVRGANVRAFLSGHLHLVEDLSFSGHRLIRSGSVNGHQWGGLRMGTPEGFGVFDCRPDGTLDFLYQLHGWRADA